MFQEMFANISKCMQNEQNCSFEDGFHGLKTVEKDLLHCWGGSY